MKVTPVQHGKFDKNIHTYLWKTWESNPHIYVSVSPFPLSATDPSSDVEAKTKYRLSSSSISYENKPLFSWFCSEMHMTIMTELNLHCSTLPFYQGCLVVRHIIGQKRTFQVCKVALKIPKCVFTALPFRMSYLIWQQDLAKSSSVLSGDSPSEVITLHIRPYLILEME